MPNVLLIASAEGAKILVDELETIGPVLQKAAAEAIADLGGDPNKVAVYVTTYVGAYNASELWIAPLLSWSEEREASLPELKRALASAWEELLQGVLSPYKEIFPLDEVEIWPIAPPGSWGLASKILVDS